MRPRERPPKSKKPGKPRGFLDTGLQCCRHAHNLLDADQSIPPEILRYHFKLRFWFEVYEPAPTPSHLNLDRLYWQTEANAGEYDVPPAFKRPGVALPGYPDYPEATPTPGTTCTGSGATMECVHEIHFDWTSPDMRLIYAGGHCHAPSCISIELYQNATGTPELLCRQETVYGDGDPKIRFDDAGYLTLPPCLWGSADEGLQPSILLKKGTPLFSIKKNRNTHMGHFGEMASWQMRGTAF